MRLKPIYFLVFAYVFAGIILNYVELTPQYPNLLPTLRVLHFLPVIFYPVYTTVNILFLLLWYKSGYMWASLFASSAYNLLVYATSFNLIAKSLESASGYSKVILNKKFIIAISATTAFTVVLLLMPAPTQLSEIESSAASRLFDLGYIDYVVDEVGKRNVTYIDEDKSQSGVNILCSKYSDKVRTFDMQGNVLSEFGLGDFENCDLVHYINGHYLVLIKEYPKSTILKFDKDQKLLWKIKGRYHHELTEDKLGNIYTLEQKAEYLHYINPYKLLLNDYIVKLSPTGELLSRKSVAEIYRDSKLITQGFKSSFNTMDFFHTNSISISEDGTKAVVSIRNLDSLVELNLGDYSVNWVWGYGIVENQHHASY